MRVADLVERHPPLLHLGDEHPTRQPMVDQTARAIGPTKCADGERHGPGHYPFRVTARGVIPVIVGHVGHTGRVVANINFGPGTPDDDELRLCGDVSDGQARRRARHLALVQLDRLRPRGRQVDRRRHRRRSDRRDPPARCGRRGTRPVPRDRSRGPRRHRIHAPCEVVLAAHTIGEVDDLGRLLRQVHRILKPSMPFVLSMPHPFAGVDVDHPYGAEERTIGSWFTALNRSNFRVDHVHRTRSVGDTTVADHPRAARAQGRFLTEPAGVVPKALLSEPSVDFRSRRARRR